MTASAEEIDQRLRDFQREYIDFLDDGDQQGIYSTLVRYLAPFSKILHPFSGDSTRPLSGI